MTDSPFAPIPWARYGGICGVLAVLSYVSVVALPLPDVLGTAGCAAFGPLLGLASLALYHVLAERRRSFLLYAGATSNLLAGAILTMMLLVQLATRHEARKAVAAAADGAREVLRAGARIVNQVQLGLDVAWDVYICAGTICFGLAMLSDRRFGRVLGGVGIGLAVALLALNLWTFPVPPAEAGLFDLGPLCGMWYLVVSVVLLWQSRAAKALETTAGATA